MLAQLTPYLIGLAALIGGLFTVYAKGRREGSSSVKAKQAQAEAKATSAARKVEDDVRKTSDSDVDERLSRWMRDTKR